MPVLFKKGCRANIFIPKYMKRFFEVMFADNLKIVNSDAEYLSKRENKVIEPLYSQEDVNNMLDHMVEVEMGKMIQLDEYFSFRFTANYHILHSAQIEVFIKDKNYNKTIWFSGDIGNISLKNKPFVTQFKPIKYADVGLVESTYAMNVHRVNKKVRDKDIEKIKTCISETCVEDNESLIFASFAMQRLQEILYILYNTYGEDEKFTTPIIIDSPLGIKLTKLFTEEGVLPEDERQIVIKMLSWKNLQFTSEWKQSEFWQKQSGDKIVLACSGFAESGRIRAWLKINIPNPKARVVFIGYSTPDSLSGILKEGVEPTIEIDDTICKNRCKVNNLLSFTSHIQHEDMLNLYSDINCKELYLVHSEMGRRIQFAELLKQKIKEKCKSTKVFIGSKDLEIEL